MSCAPMSDIVIGQWNGVRNNTSPPTTLVTESYGVSVGSHEARHAGTPPGVAAPFIDDDVVELCGTPVWYKFKTSASAHHSCGTTHCHHNRLPNPRHHKRATNCAINEATKPSASLVYPQGIRPTIFTMYRFVVILTY